METWRKEMSDNESVAVEFWMGPNDHPMSLAHEAEASRCSAEFWSFGKVLADDGILSKTDKGFLETWWSAKSQEWQHRWLDWDYRPMEPPIAKPKREPLSEEELQQHYAPMFDAMRKINDACQPLGFDAVFNVLEGVIMKQLLRLDQAAVQKMVERLQRRLPLTLYAVLATLDNHRGRLQ
jgi:hypothetical protein